MSLRIVDSEAEPTIEYFASLLGKVRVTDDRWKEVPNWYRLVAVASTKGYTFVAETASTPSSPRAPSTELSLAIRVFNTTDLVAAVRAEKTTDTAVQAPEHLGVSIAAPVTFVSVAPREKTLLLCTTEPWVELYDIAASRSAPLVLKQRIALDAAVVYATWSCSKAFVALTATKRAHHVTTKGVVQEWLEKEPLITLDVGETVSAWVKESDPSRLIVHGVTEIDVNRVQQFCDEGAELVVTSVKILSSEMLALTVVSLNEGQRQSMQMGVIAWEATARDVTVYPPPLNFILADKVMDADPFLCHSLSAVEIVEWGTWLIGCNEDTSEPLKLVIVGEDAVDLVLPEESFVWPLTETQDDNLMLGMGLDVSVPLRIASGNSKEVERMCHLAIAASEDGLLILSAIGKETEDITEPVADEDEESTSEDSTAVEVPVESESSTDEHPSSEDLVELNEMPPHHEVPIPEAGPTVLQEEIIQEEYCVEEAETEGPTLEQIIAVVNVYNADATKHIDQFNLLRRLAYESNILKMRAIELSMSLKRISDRVKQNAVAPEIQQKVDTLSRLRNTVQAVHQVTQGFQFSMRKAEGMEPEQLQLDIGATRQHLKAEKKRLEELETQEPRHVPRTWEELEEQVEKELHNFHPVPETDRCVDRMSELFAMFDPPVMETQVEEDSDCDVPSDPVWRCVAGGRQLDIGIYVGEMLDLPPLNGGPHVLKRSGSQGGTVWLPAGVSEESTSTSETGPSESEDSDSEVWQIASEDEIEKIMMAQGEGSGEHPPEMTEISEDAEIDPVASAQRLIRPDPELEECMRVMRLVDGVAALNRRSQEPVMLKLSKAPAAPTKEEFLRNLGIESPRVTESTPAESPVQPVPSPPQTELPAQTSPEPTPQPISQPAVVAQTPPVVLPASAPQQTQPSYFQAAGFSGFGMPSQMGSMGVAPQLGSLQQGAAQASSNSPIGSGFGAYAQSDSVFGAFAGGQSGQAQSAFGALAAGRGGQSQSAFGAIGQQTAPQSFGGANPSSNLGFSGAQASSKLFEMRK